MKLTILVSALVLCLVEADQPPTGYKQPGMPYDFNYGVNDEYAGLNYGQKEDSDGNVVRGSYQVQLPDGRIQVVTYEADHDNGFRSNVEYKGEAQFPHEFGPPITFKPQHSGYQPTTPSYKPRTQPTYQPPQPSYQTPQPSYEIPQPTYQ
ncbi:unnamed protein product [Meganyctiphanes norvegica]|uniref:Cuticle protein n=1 Tax=Meganyctiphanes norvegica TaxID=48144 RepID=A0AAV2QQQ6_MEGNR